MTTSDFADTLDFGWQNRREPYLLDAVPKIPPPGPRERRLEAVERLNAAGKVVLPLGDDEIQSLGERIEAMSAEAVTISLLRSCINGCHESQLVERLKERVRFVAYFLTALHEAVPADISVAGQNLATAPSARSRARSPYRNGRSGGRAQLRRQSGSECAASACRP